MEWVKDKQSVPAAINSVRMRGQQADSASSQVVTAECSTGPMKLPVGDKSLWNEEFRVMGSSLVIFNQNVIPWMKVRGDEYKRYAHAEAKRRGWKFNSETMEYEEPAPLTEEERAKVIDELGRLERRKHTAYKLKPTIIPHVSAYWECNAADESGVLLIVDDRKNPRREYWWNGMPRKYYERMFEPQALKNLQDIITMCGLGTVHNQDWLEIVLKTYEAS